MTKIPWNGVNGLDFPASRALPDDCATILTKEQKMKSDWNPEAVLKLRPAERHFAWLDHEARYHQDPVAHQIISEIRAMLHPERFLAIRAAAVNLQGAIDEYVHAME